MTTSKTKGAAGDVAAAVHALSNMTASQLRDRYQQLFGEPTRTGNRDFLINRLGWRIQSLAEGSLSERAKRRAEELARDADLRTSIPRPTKVSGQGAALTLPLAAMSPPAASSAHDRLPGPGTLLTRTYRGKRVSVTVLSQGFDYNGQVYRSLSAVAKVITGSHWNGHLFFGLKKNSKKGASL